ncbi:unnamed protein product, partial [Amoebophrya sp. A25]|eukprot:GSA25T00020696001.1
MRVAFGVGTTVDVQAIQKLYLLGVEPKWELFFPHIFCPPDQQDEDGRAREKQQQAWSSTPVLSRDAWLSLPVSPTHWRPIDKGVWHER